MKTSKAVVFEKGNLCFRSEFFNSIGHFLPDLGRA